MSSKSQHLSDPQIHSFPLDARVGILGGGQLARMLGLAAYELGFHPYVLSKDHSDPAAQVTPHWTADDPLQPQYLPQLFQQVSVVTFESEFLNMKPIETTLANSNLASGTVRISPSPSTMALLQDRRTQKAELVRFGIATARFVPIDSVEHLGKVKEHFPKGCILKKAQGGYDGYGTFVIATEKDLNRHRDSWQGPYIAEEKIKFKHELAVLLFRNVNGDFAEFPLVVSEQVNSKCDLVWGPVRHPKLPALAKKFQKLMRAMDYVGALAVELFDNGKDLIVNEVAPRVHNSGHYSMDALNHSQFDMHLRAILGLPFPEIKILSKAFVMANLVGESNKAMLLPSRLQGNLHWYGKGENRPGRKMGHINYVGPNLDTLRRLAKAERNRIER